MGDHATTNNSSTTEAAFAEKGKGKAQDPELSMEEDSSDESENGDEMVSRPCALLMVSIEHPWSLLLIYGNRSTTVHNPSCLFFTWRHTVVCQWPHAPSTNHFPIASPLTNFILRNPHITNTLHLDDEDADDNLEPISEENIISGGRRTRGKNINWEEVRSKASDEMEEDEDDDEDYHGGDDDQMHD